MSFLTSQMPVLSGRINFVLFWWTSKEFFSKLLWNTAKMVKNLQCLITLQLHYLRHAEHLAKNRMSLRGLDHDTLFFEWPIKYHKKLRSISTYFSQYNKAFLGLVLECFKPNHHGDWKIFRDFRDLNFLLLCYFH